MKRFIACLLFLLIAGCAASQNEFKVTTPDSYPLDTDIELTYAVSISEYFPGDATSLNDLPFKKNLQELTGIKVKFIHPYTQDAFQLMLSSSDLPDIIEYGWLSEYQNPSKLIRDGVIISLDELFEYVSPNLKQYLEEHPDVSESIKTADGHYFMYPFIRENDLMTTCRGYMMRKDVLDQYGLPLPETLEEWEAALVAFRDYGLEIPLDLSYIPSNINTDPVIGAFGIGPSFYLEDGVVKLGSMQSSYREYLALLQRWYKEGLIGKELTTSDHMLHLETLILESKVGAIAGTAGGQLGPCLARLKKEDPTVQFAPVKYAVKNKGEKAFWGEKANLCNGLGAAITTQCKNKEIAARLLDFGYSEQGHMFYNFGIEDESYTMVNGYPTYIADPFSTGSPLSFSQTLSQYTRSPTNGPFIQDFRYLEQYYYMDEQKAALSLWTDTSVSEHLLPQTILSLEEKDELISIIQKLNQYQLDVWYHTILGSYDLSYLDTEYQTTLNELGAQRAIELIQQSYDRLQENLAAYQ